MLDRTSTSLIKTAVAGGFAALGLAFSAPAQAQPYYDTDYSAAPSVGDVVVNAPHRQERTAIGAPIVWAHTSRVVNVSDLDLSTGWGVHEMRSRVERAAADACDALDSPAGMVSMDRPSNGECIDRAVDDAMAQAGF